MNTLEIIDLCKKLGAVLIPINSNKLKIEADEPLSSELITALTKEKSKVIIELRRQLREEAECWMLAEWRKISIPDWRRILKESISKGDKKREAYARWMLQDVLKDPDYKTKYDSK